MRKKTNNPALKPTSPASQDRSSEEDEGTPPPSKKVKKPVQKSALVDKFIKKKAFVQPNLAPFEAQSSEEESHEEGNSEDEDEDSQPNKRPTTGNLQLKKGTHGTAKKPVLNRFGQASEEENEEGEAKKSEGSVEAEDDEYLDVNKPSQTQKPKQQPVQQNAFSKKPGLVPASSQKLPQPGQKPVPATQQPLGKQHKTSIVQPTQTQKQVPAQKPTQNQKIAAANGKGNPAPLAAAQKTQLPPPQRGVSKSVNEALQSVFPDNGDYYEEDEMKSEDFPDDDDRDEDYEPPSKKKKTSSSKSKVPKRQPAPSKKPPPGKKKPSSEESSDPWSNGNEEDENSDPYQNKRKKTNPPPKPQQANLQKKKPLPLKRPLPEERSSGSNNQNSEKSDDKEYDDYKVSVAKGKPAASLQNQKPTGQRKEEVPQEAEENEEEGKQATPQKQSAGIQRANLLKSAAKKKLFPTPRPEKEDSEDEYRPPGKKLNTGPAPKPQAQTQVQRPTFGVKTPKNPLKLLPPKNEESSGLSEEEEEKSEANDQQAEETERKVELDEVYKPLEKKLQPILKPQQPVPVPTKPLNEESKENSDRSDGQQKAIQAEPKPLKKPVSKPRPPPVYKPDPRSDEDSDFKVENEEDDDDEYRPTSKKRKAPGKPRQPKGSSSKKPSTTSKERKKPPSQEEESKETAENTAQNLNPQEETPVPEVNSKKPVQKKAASSQKKEKRVKFQEPSFSKDKDDSDNKPESALEKSEEKKPTAKPEKPQGTPTEGATKQIRVPFLGSSNFKVLRENGSMVDKSSLIMEFLKSENRIMAFLYPRRFGKSTNLHMLNVFFEVEADDLGNEIDPKAKKNPVYFLGGAVEDAVLEPLEIAKYKEFVSKHMGKYPTIYLDLSNVCEGTDFDSMRNGFKKYVCELFMRHSYLNQSKKLKPKDKMFIQDFFTSTFPNERIGIALRALSQALTKHWGRKPFLFVDEYDAPTNYILGNEKFNKACVGDTIWMYYRVFTSMIKGSEPSIERTLITGVVHVVNAGFITDISTCVQYNVATSSFSSNYYGFTRNEVQELLAKSGCPEEYLGQIEKWYGGFLIQSKEVFHPHSIVKCFRTLAEHNGNPQMQKTAFTNQWEESGNLEVLLMAVMRFVDFQKELKNLINHQTLPFPRGDYISKEVVEKLYSMSRDNALGFESSKEFYLIKIFFKMLYFAGYLSLKSEDQMQIPNEEIREELCKRFRQFFEVRYEMDFMPASECLSELFDEENQDKAKLAGLLQDFGARLNEVLNKCPLMVEETNAVLERNPNEDLFHSLLFAIALTIRDRIYFETEVYCSNEDRCEVVMVSPAHQTALIIEVKFNKSAADALKLINEQTSLKPSPNNAQIRKKILVGVNVSKEKTCELDFLLE